jgi:rhombotail lipoprotein
MENCRKGWFLLFCLVLLGAGCAPRSQHQASSVVDYLYPGKSQTVVAPATPLLSLPLRVGIAFVPDTSPAKALSEQGKHELLRKIGAEFEQYPFVKSIEVIPSAYLRPKGSFENLDQIQTMFGLDVIALVSYDQVQHTDEGLLSLSYWTLVGAYVVKGEKNDTSTMIDAAVYDIRSRKLLFRAPGTSQIKGRATPVNLTEQLRRDAQEGFTVAGVELVVNLKEQLELFKTKIKNAPEEYKVEHRAGYTGGGSLDLFFALAAMALSGGWWWVGRRSS